MKLNIEKTAKGVKVEFAKDSATKPVSFVLDESKARALMGLVETALQLEVFKFSIDL